MIEAALQAGHELDPRLVAGVDGLDGFGEVGGEGFFAEDVLAVGGAGLDLVGVEGGGGADPYGVNFGVGDDAHGVQCEFGDSELQGRWGTRKRERK